MCIKIIKDTINLIKHTKEKATRELNLTDDDLEMMQKLVMHQVLSELC